MLRLKPYQLINIYPMKKLISSLFVIANISFGTAFAADPAPKLPGGTEVETVTIEAEVTALNLKTREATLKVGDKSYTVTVSPKVANLDKVKVGDIVVSNHSQVISYQVIKGDGIRETSEQSAKISGQPSGKPAGGKVVEVTVVANIIGIDTKTGVVTMKAGAERIVQYKVKDLNILKNVKVGDQVIIAVAEEVDVQVVAKKK